MEKVQPKRICHAFDEQLDISESLYKMNLKFRFTKKDVTELLETQKAIQMRYENGETIIFAECGNILICFRRRREDNGERTVENK